jgi:hypothetical protein
MPPKKMIDAGEAGSFEALLRLPAIERARQLSAAREERVIAF